MTDIEQALRAEIQTQLKKVNKSNTPKIHAFIQDKSGYLEIEKRIILMVIQDNITPSACIPQIEVEL